MDIDLFIQVLLGILSLLGIALIFSIIYLFVLWVVFRIGKWFINLKYPAQIISNIKTWWSKPNNPIILYWDALYTYMEPAFWTIILFVLAKRMDEIIDKLPYNPEYTFWQLLDIDMRHDMSFYIVIFIFIILWMIWRARKHSQEIKLQKLIISNLDGINKAIELQHQNISQNNELIENQNNVIDKLCNKIDGLIDIIKEERINGDKNKL